MVLENNQHRYFNVKYSGMHELFAPLSEKVWSYCNAIVYKHVTL